MGNPKDRKTETNIAQRIVDLTRSAKAYPAFDRIVMGYVATVLLFQVMFQISPVVTFLTKTPLYSIQTYLGLLGGGLVLVDLVTSKRLWQGPYSILLFGICACAGLASVRMISYGMKENLFKLCWMMIQFAICYSCAFRMERDSLKKFFVPLFRVLLAIWIVAVCVSLYQYANQIRYWHLVNPLAKDASYTRQGFFDNRLFGVFYTLNHAAFISVLFGMIGAILMIRTGEKRERILLGIAELLLLCHVILSGSRSARIALHCCMFFLIWFLIWNRYEKKGLRTVLISTICGALAAAVTFCATAGLKAALVYVPYVNAKIVSLFDRPDQEEPNGPDETEPEDEQTELDKEVLDRQNLEEDPSNGRLSIWKDYITLYDDVGPIGLSPGNYMPYIYENHPELYIVDYIKNHYPAKYESGIIYHVHNGYLMVYVSAGWIGTALLLAFIVLCVRRLLLWILRGDRVNDRMICVFLLALAVAVSALFDEGIFFQNNPQTTVFWIALGILMKESAGGKRKS